MERDGKLVSLWQNAAASYNTKRRNLPGGVMDVAVIGGGITGLSTALRLQQSGVNCILIESHTIGFGTTGGTTAHVNTFFDNPYHKIEKDFGEENASLVYEAALSAISIIEKNILEWDIACDFAYKNAFIYSKNEDETEALEKLAEASGKAGMKVSFTDSLSAGFRYEKALLLDDQVQFHPVKYIYGLAQAFEQQGGILLQQCKLESFEEGSPIHLSTTLGEIQCKQLIFATHIPPGINLLHFRCAPYRSYVIAAELNNNNYPEALIYDMEDPYHYYRSHEVNQQMYLIAGGEDHKTGHADNANSHFLQLENHVRQHFDIRSIPFRWSSQFYEPADGLAYIGKLPGHDKNIFVATGFGGNGMTYSHIAAEHRP
jgi:glycine/D-amino acid oxidase-like deaminating enzyme